MTDADEFLEHYGVKGMRWGKRKSKSSNSKDGSRSDKKPRNYLGTTKADRIALGVGIAAMGAAYIMGSRAMRSGMTVKEMTQTGQKTIQIGSSVAKTIAAQRRDMSDITAKLAETNRLADAQLRDWNNKFDVPVPQRSYSTRRR